MLKRSVFNIRALSSLPCPCLSVLLLLALQLLLRSKDTDLRLQQTLWANIRMQTAFAENAAAETFGELSLEPTGQLPQSLQLSKYHIRYCTF